jgi:hypothetical protein
LEAAAFTIFCSSIEGASRGVFVAEKQVCSGVVGDSDGEQKLVKLFEFRALVVVGVGGEQIQTGSSCFQDPLFWLFL